jgi:hypothetical protein
MASPSIKATYSLDPETVRLLERTARRWGVSKSEALRRAIRAAANPTAPDEGEALLDRLHDAAGLTSAGAQTRTRQVREERRKSAATRVKRD